MHETNDILADPLTKLFQASIDEEKVPDEWKIANITAIHKKGPKSSASNYRPISLTSVTSKIMEKLVRDALLDHMNNNHLFTKHQHVFRKGYSCVTQLIDVLGKLDS